SCKSIIVSDERFQIFDDISDLFDCMVYNAIREMFICTVLDASRIVMFTHVWIHQLEDCVISTYITFQGIARHPSVVDALRHFTLQGKGHPFVVPGTPEYETVLVHCVLQYILRNNHRLKTRVFKYHEISSLSILHYFNFNPYP